MTRSRRSPLAALIPALAIWAALLLGAGRAGAQQSAAAVRFPITQTGDSTLRFPVAGHSWVKSGAQGVAVDPRRRDDVVARFRVLKVERGEAMALITGQTTVVTTQHVAVLEPPPAPWYRRGSFWAGMLIGAAVGGAAGALATK